MNPMIAAISISMLTAILKAAFGLGFVIFVHELGHFLVAKACGVKCEKFYVGFDVPIKIGPIQLPRTLFRKQWGETEYGIGIVPLGGYVKMLGQDDNPANSAKEAERIRVAREESGAADAGDAPEIDPRSYPAKSVPQRLAIISAGVIMNLIFAVIFSMIAYRMGVSYTPCIVGSTTPGLSAWQVGLQTGDRIIQMDRDGTESENLRFDKDMVVKVMMTGANQDLDLRIQPYSAPGTTPQLPMWVDVELSSPREELNGRPVIGISPYATTKIGLPDEKTKLLSNLPIGQANPPLKFGDQIVAVNGDPVVNYEELSVQLARRVDEDLKLTIKRKAESGQAEADQFESILPRNPLRSLGINLRIGPIVAIQNGSLAEKVGLKVDDRVLTVNGNPIGDPLTLPAQLRRLAGKAVTIGVERPGVDEPVSISVTPVEPDMLHLGSGIGDPLAVEAVGFAFTIENVIVSVTPGSPADQAGVQAGDLLQEVGFIPASEEEKRLEEEIFSNLSPIPLGDKNRSWPVVQERIQMSQPNTKFNVVFIRDDLQKNVELVAVKSSEWNVPDRGLRLMTDEEVHRVSSWSDAFSLGVRETNESISQVYFILFRLVTGRISPTNLGGPASIATMAGMEANQSTARLLIFLTMLSANLAVINFLPIPVLDGGHAMFLLYEGIFRRPVNDRIAFGLTMAGFCFILGLMIFVIGLDVWRFSGLAS
ncbi:MAG: site-2 protease family protein [Pirellulaceae bacterium]|nr:site-2 protease family protein [Pirellulaceae bacterium]